MIGTSTISTREFRRFQSLVQAEAGISLSDQKRALLVGRLAPRLRALGLSSFETYLAHVEENAAELVHMIDAICTNETQFFREPRQFAYMENELLPAWRAAADARQRGRQVRVWSAACSTGEEPYSLAMMLLTHLPGWSIEIVATDLSTKALARASAGVWPIERAEQIPPHYRKQHMLRGSGPQEGRMAAKPELSSLITFTRMNLHHAPYPINGRFDLIFCRNVLIYFDAPSKQDVIDRLLDRLEPGGLLFLGHSETLNRHERVRPAGPTVYALNES